MKQECDTGRRLTIISKGMLRQLLAIGENRVEILRLELQELQERLFRLILLAMGVVALGFLAGVACSIAMAFLFWETSPGGVLLCLAGIYGLTSLILYRRLISLVRESPILQVTLEQLKKDRVCLTEILT